MKIGIDLGGSHIAVGIVSEEGKLLEKYEENILFTNEQKDKMKELIRDKILSLINSVLRRAQIPIFVVEEIGIGIPGVVENNIIKNCKKYGIEEWDLAKELQEFYKIDVKLSNDAMCSAKAERKYGNLQGVNRAVFLCLGTGIGGTTILEDKIFESEYGHMTIERNGKECYCGKKGCFETYCSMKTFKKKVIQLLNLNENTSSEELLEILKSQKDSEVLNQYIDEYLSDLVLGISNIVNIIKPEKICIGGSFAYFEEILLFKLKEKVKTYTYQYRAPEIVLASLKNDAGIIGATIDNYRIMC